MHRSAVLLVMLLALLWQSVALARAGSTVNALADLAHTALHWQAQGHHHHEDGSYHLDDSTESTQHVLIDPMSTTAALIGSSCQDVPPLGSAAPGGRHDTVVCSPPLDGLLRPPRSHA